ncbi:uncharacterized protein [Aristolochia californica]|uniref:uncharacterized protein n=1 Tax=Aristolochia californica TaxID=171875 RepID=UPI0035DA6FD7
MGTLEVAYLDLVISSSGVKVDTSKIQAMIDWPTPHLVMALRGFLGLAGYYRKFIASAPVLQLPNFDEPFVIEFDAFGGGIGAVLQQQGHIIAYFSRHLVPHHHKLAAYARELINLGKAIQNWRPYLWGRPFVCQRNKAESLNPTGLLQPLQLPSQVWADISMDFIDGLPKSSGKYVILVVVDRFSKYGHLRPMAHPYTVTHVTQGFMDQIVRLHGLLESITNDRDAIFTSNFWTDLFKLHGTKLAFSSAYHPQTGGQTEVVNHTLEMYLRCFEGDTPHSWTHLDKGSEGKIVVPEANSAASVSENNFVPSKEGRPNSTERGRLAQTCLKNFQDPSFTIGNTHPVEGRPKPFKRGNPEPKHSVVRPQISSEQPDLGLLVFVRSDASFINTVKVVCHWEKLPKSMNFCDDDGGRKVGIASTSHSTETYLNSTTSMPALVASEEHEQNVATEKATLEKQTTDIKPKPPKGVILYGEPGTGKTLLAKTVANSTSATVLRVVGIELIQTHLGDAPKWGREPFKVADEFPPAIVVIDEINAGGTKRYDAHLEYEVRQLREAAEVEGNGIIDYIDFITVMMLLNIVEKEHHLYTAFENYDKDNSASKDGPAGFATQGFCRDPLRVGFAVTYKIDVEMLSRIQTSVWYWVDIVPIDMESGTKILNSKKWGKLLLTAAMPFNFLKKAGLTVGSPNAAAIVAAKQRDETLEERGWTNQMLDVGFEEEVEVHFKKLHLTDRA